MRPIQLIRNSYLGAYIQALRTHDVAPTPLLAAHGIPTDFERLPDYVITASAVHGFIMEAAEYAAPGLISAAAGLHNARSQRNPFNHSLEGASTLLEAIRRHNEVVATYSPGNRFDTQMQAGFIGWRKIGRSPLPETEIFCVASLVGHIRTELGANWKPTAIEISVADPAVVAGLPSLKGSKIRVVNTDSVVVFPGIQAAMPLRGALTNKNLLTPEPEILVSADLDFLGSLRLLLMGFARVGVLNVDSAALAVGLSRRTLQRRLHDTGVTFSDLADQSRYQVACELLRNAPELTVTEIALELGYRDPGSFTRAFRRFAGQPPSAYRRAGIDDRTAA